MGTIHSISCTKCKVTRDLDKLNIATSVKNRLEATNHADMIAKNSFRASLMISFMAEHKGHECVFFDEHSTCASELDAFWDSNEYKKDYDFWDKRN